MARHVATERIAVPTTEISSPGHEQLREPAERETQAAHQDQRGSDQRAVRVVGQPPAGQPHDSGRHEEAGGHGHDEGGPAARQALRTSPSATRSTA